MTTILLKIAVVTIYMFIVLGLWVVTGWIAMKVYDFLAKRINEILSKIIAGFLQILLMATFCVLIGLIL